MTYYDGHEKMTVADKVLLGAVLIISAFCLSLVMLTAWGDVFK